MSKILARFKRAASTSSDDQGSPRERQLSFDEYINGPGYVSGATPGSEDETIVPNSSSTLGPTVTRSPARTTYAGSHFIEEAGGARAPSLSPLNRSTVPVPGGTLTPSPSKRSALELPDSTSKLYNQSAFGTPKLVLTDPDTNSPRSFNSSPGKGGTGGNLRPEGLGLGIGGVADQAENTYDPSINSSSTASIDFTPRLDDPFPLNPRQNSKSTLSIETTAQNENNLSPNTPASTGTPDDRSLSDRPRSGSIISRLRGSGTSPRLSPTALLDPKSDRSVPASASTSKRKMDKEKRHRRLSASSGKAKSIAAAIVSKVGHNMTGSSSHSSSATPDDHGSKRHSLRPQSAIIGDDRYSYDYEDDDDDESDSELDDDLPVTGFAVASNRRNADFHALFPTVDEGDYLIEDYGCALSKDILVQGRLYVSESHVCFHANIFGWVTDLVIPFADIRLIEKKMTALVIPNAIGISTGKDKYTFASFLSRDTTFDVMMNIWRLCNPNAVMSSLSLANNSRPPSVAGTDIGDSPTTPAAPAVDGGIKPAKGHAPTQCACGKEGKHYSETALAVTLPTTPEKVYNLMFTGEWIKTFLTDNQKLRELEMSDWKPISSSDKLYTRSMSYIKPLNGSIGPKQTKCHIVDEQAHFDLETYISTVTTTRTPDVPSGGVFSVKTRTCLTWAGGNATKVLVTTAVEWTGKSWVKGIIEKSAIDGQKQYHDDLIKAMRAHIKQHPTEFGGPELADDSADGGAPAAGTALAGEDGAETQTAAEAYAAETRKKRQQEDLGYIQGGLDSVVSGLGTVFSGLKAVFESISDLLSDLPVSKEIILGSIILLLVLSNIWTYASFKGEAPERQARRAGRENDLSEVIRLLLEKQAGGAALSTSMGRPEGRGIADPRGEVADLLRVLEDVERRAASLKSAIQQAGPGAGRQQQDLD